MTRNLTMFEPYPHSSSLRIALIAFPTLVTATVAYVDGPSGMQSSYRFGVIVRVEPTIHRFSLGGTAEG